MRCALLQVSGRRPAIFTGILAAAAPTGFAFACGGSKYMSRAWQTVQFSGTRAKYARQSWKDEARVEPPTFAQCRVDCSSKPKPRWLRRRSMRWPALLHMLTSFRLSAAGLSSSPLQCCSETGVAVGWRCAFGVAERGTCQADWRGTGEQVPLDAWMIHSRMCLLEHFVLLSSQRRLTA